MRKSRMFMSLTCLKFLRGRGGEWERGGLRDHPLAPSPTPPLGSSPPHRPIGFSSQLPISDGISLVMKLLALDQRDFGLGPRALEVEGEGNTGDASSRDGARPAV